MARISASTALTIVGVLSGSLAAVRHFDQVPALSRVDRNIAATVSIVFFVLALIARLLGGWRRPSPAPTPQPSALPLTEVRLRVSSRAGNHSEPRSPGYPGLSPHQEAELAKLEQELGAPGISGVPI